ncbi:hypothetical protein BP6252_11399 [Coleophoma cylindrospora]|uniref:NAD-dependent epimerase/dehydratase domain-containing protein n=1 Tax=Coleophoma cylindrospora TaxID=1849047 RepID=A0A3D8QJG6_9HELO|nr:hypothetical protein BP6252_11399 [Coleophoma cylindrospora]
MTRILLTGGSGFLAAHILELLLKEGHSVVTTVRSQSKADKIKETFPSYTKEHLDFAIVEDVAKPDAFDSVVVSNPPFEAVIHTASPFHFAATNIQKELLDPAVVGTTSILKAVKASAPAVKRVVITSSFAALANVAKGDWPEHTYTEEDWNPMTVEEALANVYMGYAGSKAFAEKAAWDFIKTESPSFSLATINPTLIFGPIFPKLHSLSSLNTSNALTYAITQGAAKEKIPDMGGHCWVDVRDVALAHVRAIDAAGAENQRFFLTANENFNNRTVVDIIRKNFPEYQSSLPSESVEGGNYPPGGIYKTDNSKSTRVLGIKYHDLETAIVDTVKSFKAAS